jgi:hypothetical protein
MTITRTLLILGAYCPALINAFAVQPRTVQNHQSAVQLRVSNNSWQQQGGSQQFDVSQPTPGRTTGPFGTAAAGSLTDSSQQKKIVWDSLAPVIVQGGSLRTWSFATEAIERVQVLLKSDGRPLHANVELWQGPDNTPVKLAVYNEDGNLRPFTSIIETPRGQNAIAIRNTGQMEFPLVACVGADLGAGANQGTGLTDLGALTNQLFNMGSPRIVQGGAVHTYPFDPTVASVQIMLKTDGRPLNARVELLQGPNNNKQVIDLYTEDGMERPFFAVIDTPGNGNVVRIVNTAPLEFPMTARVEPYLMEVPDGGGKDGGDFFIIDKEW